MMYSLLTTLLVSEQTIPHKNIPPDPNKKHRKKPNVTFIDSQTLDGELFTFILKKIYTMKQISQKPHSSNNVHSKHRKQPPQKCIKKPQVCLCTQKAQTTK